MQAVFLRFNKKQSKQHSISYYIDNKKIKNEELYK